MLDVFDVCMEWGETLPDLPYLEVQHIASEADFYDLGGRRYFIVVGAKFVLAIQPSGIIPLKHSVKD